MDWRSCYFYDSSFPDGPPFQYAGPLGSDAVPVSAADPRHRAIVQYVYGIGDQRDAGNDGGHGTHTASTACGAPSSDPANSPVHTEFQGVAPGAKLAFYDLSNGVGLVVPGNLPQHYFRWAYAAGALGRLSFCLRRV